MLLRFFKDVNRPNLGINFDPANMILYGTGDPIEALGTRPPGDVLHATVRGALPTIVAAAENAGR